MEVQVAQGAAAEAADVGAAADAMAEVGEAAVAVVATQ